MCAASLAIFLADATAQAQPQRVLGVDISYWNCGTTSTGCSQSVWNTAYNTPNANGYTRQFAFLRATRGGTTGVDQPQGTPGGGSLSTLSRRYDDPRFIQNINRATTAGMLAGPYHFGRPDVAGNTGADEALHFAQMASAFMRPGYLMPIFDLEAGSGSDALAQFAIDFSNKIYELVQIRPGIYINGNYSSILQGATLSRRNQLAQPASYTPSVVGPAYPMLWNARYSDNSNPEAIPIQTGSPKHTYTTLSSYYGPWDDYGDSAPWSFWQYASTVSVPGFNTIDSTIDGNVSQGDIEYVRNYLVPAVWWHDNNGDWGTLANWNSGQSLGYYSQGDPAPWVPETPPDQATPYATGPLPTPRLPGAAGSGPTSGQYDTVILERPNANIVVTHSSGTTTNIRKLYMRETLHITGGSLTINYDPTYRPDDSSTVLHGGPISAQFSGPVTLSGGSLSVHTLQVDAGQTFTLAGGTLTFNTINLISSSTTKVAVTGDVTINPLNNAAAILKRSGSSGTLDLQGDTRTITVGNGSAEVDLDIAVPITNGGLTKNGAGTMRLSAANTFSGPVTINGGVLRSNNAAGFSSSSLVTVNNGGTLDLNGITDTIAALASDSGQTTGVVMQGVAGLTMAAPSGTYTFSGSITGTGVLTKTGAATQILNGNNVLGPVNIEGGILQFNGSNTTGNVTVSGGALGGSGSVTGAVTVGNGGSVSPGQSIGTLGVGALVLNTGSILDLELGPPGVSDLINVVGLLSLNGGTVQLSDAGGLDVGTYTLINYDILSGNVANLGTPVGPAGFLYELIDTGSSIELSVSLPGLPGDFNGDGIVDSADYVLWRKNEGTAEEYNIWQANFGRSAGSGSARGSNASVPEPLAMSLLAIASGMLSLCCQRHRRY